MRKLILLIGLIALSHHLSSCSSSDDDGNGNLRLLPNLEVKSPTDEIPLTRSAATADFSGYYVELKGPQTREFAFPENGLIRNLKDGNYSVSLYSHKDIPSPAFDTPYYVGTKDAAVTEGETRDLIVDMKLANAGIFFDYSESMLGSQLNFTPIISHGAGSLEYTGNNRNSCGYFPVGDATIIVQVEGYSDISREIQLSAGDLLKAKLDIDPGTDGIRITITVTPGTDPTNTGEFGVGDVDNP